MNKKIGVSCLFALTCLVSSFCFSCGENKPVDEIGHEHKLSTIRDKMQKNIGKFVMLQDVMKFLIEVIM